MDRRWIPLWILPLIALLATGTVWLRLAVVRTTYEISQANRSIRELQQKKEQAELKYAALRSPRRLELLARSRFSLTQPRADQIIHMSESSDKPMPPGPLPRSSTKPESRRHGQ